MWFHLARSAIAGFALYFMWTGIACVTVCGSQISFQIKLCLIHDLLVSIENGFSRHYVNSIGNAHADTALGRENSK